MGLELDDLVTTLSKGSFRLLTSQNLAHSQNNSNQGVGVKWTSGGGVGETDFAPSDVNDIPIDPVPTNTESYPVNVSSTSIDLCDGRNICLDAAGLPEMPESLPAQPIEVAQPSSPEDANSSFTIISPVEVLSTPKAAHTRQKRKSKRGATANLTSSSCKNQLAATNRSQSAVSGNSSKTSSSKMRSMKKAKVSRSSMQQKDTVDESDNNVMQIAFTATNCIPNHPRMIGGSSAPNACDGRMKPALGVMKRMTTLFVNYVFKN
ncbi:unnamed protein product [Clavelina lepadiformis]|uniref:Uncharacterized protein n=1 Tax=Clavelina lepadiformis TaxID=159417 RepID=A0ABP0FYG3_CLALP